MKTLIAISTCGSFEEDGSNQAIRETWLSERLPAGFDARLFVGRTHIPAKPDTVLLDCGDDYYNLTWKTIEKLKWGLDRGYDFFFCCMADTYALPARLATCGFENFDILAGFFRMKYNERPDTIKLTRESISGGSGFFLSRRAAQIVINSPKPSGWFSEMLEDGFVTGCLLPEKHPSLKRRGDLGMFVSMAGVGPRAWNRAVTKHIFQRWTADQAFHPNMIRDEYRSYRDSVAALPKLGAYKAHVPTETWARDLRDDMTCLKIDPDKILSAPKERPIAPPGAPEYTRPTSHATPQKKVSWWSRAAFERARRLRELASSR